MMPTLLKLFLTTSILYVILAPSEAVPSADFFSEKDVITLISSDDATSLPLRLQYPLPVFSQTYTSVYVNTNGVVSLSAPFGSVWAPSTFPISQTQRNLPKVPLFAPFFSDVNTRRGGTIKYKVYYRNTEKHLGINLKAEREVIKYSWVNITDFRSVYVCVATWRAVQPYCSRGCQSHTNTFQVALTTNGTHTFAIYNYLDNGMRWATPTYAPYTKAHGNLDGNFYAVAGYDINDDRHYYNVHGSRTSGLLNIHRMSNVGVRGKFVFPLFDTNLNNTNSSSQQCFCLNGGHCSQSMGVCVCPSGWSGRICDEDINECSDNNGNCEHSCANTEGSYACRCRPGYRIHENGRTCVDVNECQNDNGGCDTFCVNTLGSFECSCDRGFKLQGKKCVDINECTVDNGGCSQLCVNLIGSRSCACRHGYKLWPHTHGTQCVDVNECSPRPNLLRGGCDHLCININGSYMCSCRPGFLLAEDNHTCVDLNECAVDNGGCDNDICINTIGSFHCEENIGSGTATEKPTEAASATTKLPTSEATVHTEVTTATKEVTTATAEVTMATAEVTTATAGVTTVATKTSVPSAATVETTVTTKKPVTTLTTEEHTATTEAPAVPTKASTPSATTAETTVPTKARVPTVPTEKSTATTAEATVATADSTATTAETSATATATTPTTEGASEVVSTGPTGSATDHTDPTTNKTIAEVTEETTNDVPSEATEEATTEEDVLDLAEVNLLDAKWWGAVVEKYLPIIVGVGGFVGGFLVLLSCICICFCVWRGRRSRRHKRMRRKTGVSQLSLRKDYSSSWNGIHELSSDELRSHKYYSYSTPALREHSGTSVSRQHMHSTERTLQHSLHPLHLSSQPLHDSHQQLIVLSPQSGGHSCQFVEHTHPTRGHSPQQGDHSPHLRGPSPQPYPRPRAPSPQLEDHSPQLEDHSPQSRGHSPQPEEHSP